MTCRFGEQTFGFPSCFVFGKACGPAAMVGGVETGLSASRDGGNRREKYRHIANHGKAPFVFLLFGVQGRAQFSFGGFWLHAPILELLDHQQQLCVIVLQSESSFVTSLDKLIHSKSGLRLDNRTGQAVGQLYTMLTCCYGVLLSTKSSRGTAASASHEPIRFMMTRGLRARVGPDGRREHAAREALANVHATSGQRCLCSSI